MRRVRAPVVLCNELAIDLFAPGMTALHRVGLAGLAMTLDALGAGGPPGTEGLRQLGSWAVDGRSVTLGWTGDGRDFLKALVRASFRLTDSGLIWLTALGDPLDHPASAVVLHSALLGTFLQHPRTRKSMSKQPTSLTVEVDETTQVLTFLPLSDYAHRNADIDPERPLKVAGWLYPGGVVRHVQATDETSLAESPARALALLYAPVGALFFQVHRRTVGVRPQYCLVLPAVGDLQAYGAARQIFLRQGIARLQVAGSTEAAARVLSEFEARGLLGSLSTDRCDVVAFGTVPWSKQQKTRVERFTVAGARPEALDTYRVAASALPPRLANGKPDPKTGQSERWWVVPQVPDLVARNALSGEPWWRGFGELWARVRQAARPDQREWVLSDERRGLQMIIGHERTMPDGPEARLVRACHDAWRRRLGALGERAKRQGLSFNNLANREYERVRIGFARCKSESMLRQTLTDFWSRAGGPLPDLQESWPEILPLLSERWRDARDLALLALASYKGQAVSVDETPPDGGAEEPDEESDGGETE